MGQARGKKALEASRAHLAGESENGEANNVARPDEHENAGKREAAVEAETQRIERHGDTIELAVDHLAHDLTHGLLDIYRHRRFAWNELSTQDQRDVTTAMQYAVRNALRQAVTLIAADQRDNIRCKIEKFADKGGEITVSLKIAAADESAVLALHRASGKEVLLIAADSDYLMADRKGTEPVEEPQLGFEAGSDQHPADDSDLAGGPDVETNEEDEDETLEVEA